MALPKSTPTPRTRYLQDIVNAATASDLAGWPMLNEKDYVLVGAFIVLFSYIDFNLRRVIEVFDKTGRLGAPWKGKTRNLNAVEVAAAIQSLDCWDEAGRKALNDVEELRKFRNLVAHFAVRRFPADEAFVFLAKSARDFKQQFGTDREQGAALSAVVDRDQMLGALRHVEHVQNWLATSTAKLEAHLDPR
jgi:hypothetical protein